MSDYSIPVQTVPQPSPQQEWRPVVEYEGWYEVSSCGSVRRVRGGQGARIGRVLHANLDGDGYPSVRLYKNGDNRLFTVHRLLVAAFVGAIPQGCEVNHKDGIKTNYSLSNLEIVTRQQNAIHAWENGLCSPQKNRTAKLTEVEVSEIRAKYAAGGVLQKELASEYRVSTKTICLIVKRRIWKQISIVQAEE